MNIQMSVRGGPELAAKLRRLSDEMAGKALEDAATAGARQVQNAAKKKAPFLTGTLRRSIHTATIHRSRTRATVAVGTDVPYARRIEFGFSGADQLGRRYNQPARPYLRPALDENKGNVVRKIGDALRALLARFR